MIWLLGYLALGCLAAAASLVNHEKNLAEQGMSPEQIPGWKVGVVAVAIWPVLVVVLTISVLCALWRMFRG